MENWGTPAKIFTRSTGSTAAIIAALGLGLPVANLSGTGTQESSSSNMVTAVGGVSPTAGADGIGFVSGEYADGNTSLSTADGGAGPTIKVLAYQHYGQGCGWLPSSTPNTYDKINVRNGLYALWAPVHFIAAVDGTGTPTDASAKSFIGYFTGSSARRHRRRRAHRPGGRHPRLRDGGDAHLGHGPSPPVRARGALRLLLREERDRGHLVHGLHHQRRLPRQRDCLHQGLLRGQLR